MKIAKNEPIIEDLLTKKRPYKNTITNEIKYLSIQEWMMAESRDKQQLHVELAQEAIDNAIEMSAQEFNDLLNKYNNHLMKTTIWMILEDKPSLQVLFGKKEV